MQNRTLKSITSYIGLWGLLVVGSVHAQSGTLPPLQRSPAFMGPNALPLSWTQEPAPPKYGRIDLLWEVHRGGGDRTHNPFVMIRVPFAPGKVVMDLTWRPVEWFNTTNETRILRGSRDSTGFNASDLWVAFLAKILAAEGRGKGWDLSLHVATKTTAGKNFESARHTNAPGYLFELQGGRVWRRPGRFPDRISVFARGGLLVWQESLYAQNDAFSWGVRSHFGYKSWQLGAELTGYQGWIGNGDSPVAARIDMKSPGQRMQGMIGYQYAFSDLSTHLFRAGISFPIHPQPKSN
ncbi:MAG: hypothetical protein ACKOA7_03785 [Bacteroidota bacterium]